MEQISALHLTAEEKANVQLLRITDGILIGVTNRDDLTGSLILPDTITEIGRKALSGLYGFNKHHHTGQRYSNRRGSFWCMQPLSSYQNSRERYRNRK